jgi:hypothetical protein
MPPTTIVVRSDEGYHCCCPGCSPDVLLFYARVAGGATWIEFDFVGSLNTSLGPDGDGIIYYEGTYTDGGVDYDVLLVWDLVLELWYANDVGISFLGPNDRCDPTGDYEGWIEVSATPFP